MSRLYCYGFIEVAGDLACCIIEDPVAANESNNNDSGVSLGTFDELSRSSDTKSIKSNIYATTNPLSDLL